VKPAYQVWTQPVFELDDVKNFLQPGCKVSDILDTQRKLADLATESASVTRLLGLSGHAANMERTMPAWTLVVAPGFLRAAMATADSFHSTPMGASGGATGQLTLRDSFSIFMMGTFVLDVWRNCGFRWRALVDQWSWGLGGFGGQLHSLWRVS
jgi:hypothetical protein